MAILVSSLGWLAGAALSGFIGGRVDSVSTQAINRLVQSIQRPENHDIAKGLSSSLFRSVKSFLKDFGKSNPFPGLELQLKELDRLIFDPIKTRSGDAGFESLITTLNEQLVAMLGTGDLATASSIVQRERIERIVSDAVLVWLKDDRAEEFSPLFVSVFKQGGEFGLNRVRKWSDYFRDCIGELIKQEQSRFNAILLAEVSASTNLMARETLDGLSTLSKKIAYFTGGGLTHCWDNIIAAVPRSSSFILKPSGYRIARPVHDDRFSIPLGIPFQIEAKFTHRGNVFLIQRHEGRWYPTVVSRRRIRNEFESTFIAEIGPGETRIPVDTFLVEENPSHVGMRLFVLVCSIAPIPEVISNALHNREVLDPVDLSRLAKFVVECKAERVQIYAAECRVFQKCVGNE